MDCLPGVLLEHEGLEETVQPQVAPTHAGVSVISLVGPDCLLCILQCVEPACERIPLIGSKESLVAAWFIDEITDDPDEFVDHFTYPYASWGGCCHRCEGGYLRIACVFWWRF